MIERLEESRTPLLLAVGLGGLVALLIVFQPSFLLAAPAVAVAGLAFFNLRAVLFLIPPAVALTPEIPFLGVPLRIEDLLMVPVAAGWLARKAAFKDRERTPLDRVLLAYLFVGLVATLWGGYIGTTHLSAISKDFGALFHMLKRLEFVLLFFIISDTIREPGDVRAMTYVLIASMVGLSAFGLSSYVSNQEIAVGPADPGHEPGLASMLNVALGLSLLPAASRPAKLLLAAVILFSVAAAPPTLGRNYIATTAIVMLYIGLFYQRWVLLAFPLAWAIGLFFYPPEIVQHVFTLQHIFAPDPTGAQTQGASLLSRFVPPAIFSLMSLGYSPVLGFGLASKDLGAFDSEYATQLFYTGLVGVAVFLILAVRVFRLTGETMRAAREPLDVALSRGFHLILIAYAAHSLFSPSISSSRVGAVFFMVVGLLVSLNRSVTAGKGTDEPARQEGGNDHVTARKSPDVLSHRSDF